MRAYWTVNLPTLVDVNHVPSYRQNILTLSAFVSAISARLVIFTAATIFRGLECPNYS